MAYLTLFEDFEDAGRYKWEQPTLAFLYRELRWACRHGSRWYCWMPHPYAGKLAAVPGFHAASTCYLR
ncbi:hypothetical protein H6P81_010224 [Aristolochia fimbriata]|uniref:Uncharacterized protein n=1 Tax=Aristolochia fimbriata TaxID=158543 RepID=A0AAV7ENS4_ARIFI|nr:hypothetical protein H6P81_010224 [Aristolochia fimbriata]